MGYEVPSLGIGAVPASRSFVANTSYAVLATGAPAPLVQTIALVYRLPTVPGAIGHGFTRGITNATNGWGLRVNAATSGAWNYRHTASSTLSYAAPTSALIVGAWAVIAFAVDFTTGGTAAASYPHAAYSGLVGARGLVQVATTDSGSGPANGYAGQAYSLAQSNTGGTSGLTIDIALACDWGRYMSASDVLAALADPLNQKWNPLFVSAPGMTGGKIRDEVTRATATVTGTPTVKDGLWLPAYMRRATARFVATGSSVNAAVSALIGTVASVSAGVVRVRGTLSQSVGAVTGTVASTVRVRGAVAQGVGMVAGQAGSAVRVRGTLSRSIGTLVATATAVTSSGVHGSVSRAIGTLTAVAAGTVRVAGAVSRTVGAPVATSNARVRIASAVNRVVGTLALGGVGRVMIRGAELAAVGVVTSTGSRASVSSSLTGPFRVFDRSDFTYRIREA